MPRALGRRSGPTNGAGWWPARLRRGVSETAACWRRCVGWNGTGSPPTAEQALAYHDGPLPIGQGQTLSQPYIVGCMTEAIDPQPGDRVLEIGTGSGYQTAILAELVAEVYTMETVSRLAKRAETLLDRLGYGNIRFRLGNGHRGWPEAAPFDKIVVTAAPAKLPKALLDQLKPGGRMIVPLGRWRQELVLIHYTLDGCRQERLMPVHFVPMVRRLNLD